MVMLLRDKGDISMNLVKDIPSFEQGTVSW